MLTYYMQRDGIVKSRERLIPHSQAVHKARQNQGKADGTAGRSGPTCKWLATPALALTSLRGAYSARADDRPARPCHHDGCRSRPAGRATRWRGSLASGRVSSQTTYRDRECRRRCGHVRHRRRRCDRPSGRYLVPEGDRNDLPHSLCSRRPRPRADGQPSRSRTSRQSEQIAMRVTPHADAPAILPRSPRSAALDISS